jgi:hypothetical protein
MVQQSDYWFRARKGRITASNAARILTPTGKDSSAWDSYAIELTAECIRPDEIDRFGGNGHTDRGNELEPFAIEEFSRIMGLQVVVVGFALCDNGVVGFSPDAMILRPGVDLDRDAIFEGEGEGRAIVNGRDLFMAGLEGKSPLAKNHAQYIMDGGTPAKYKPQVHFSMAGSGLPWYFMSYCLGMVPHIVLNQPDDYTAKMQDATERFLIYYGNRRTQIMPKLLGEGVAA